MNFADVQAKEKRGNQILFSRESECLQALLADIRQQKHRTLVLWALEEGAMIADGLSARYPDEKRFQTAMAMNWEWARGERKMPEAKRALLEVHAFAKEISDPADIARCHALGQACSVVHTETHAIGLPIYALTAIVKRLGLRKSEAALEEQITAYQEHLKDCAVRIAEGHRKWAKFLLDDTRPNKEQLLYEKQMAKLAE